MPVNQLFHAGVSPGTASRIDRVARLLTRQEMSALYGIPVAEISLFEDDTTTSPAAARRLHSALAGGK